MHEYTKTHFSTDINCFLRKEYLHGKKKLLKGCLLNNLNTFKLLLLLVLLLLVAPFQDFARPSTISSSIFMMS